MAEALTGGLERMRRVLGLAAAAATAGIGTQAVAQAPVTIGHAYLMSSSLSGSKVFSKPRMNLTTTTGSTFGPINITVITNAGPQKGTHLFTHIKATTNGNAQVTVISKAAEFHPSAAFIADVTASATVKLTGSDFHGFTFMNKHVPDGGWFHTNASRPHSGASLLSETIVANASSSSPVPEPASIALISAGLIGLGAARRRRLRAA